jgi:hypothetical protein
MQMRIGLRRNARKIEQSVPVPITKRQACRAGPRKCVKIAMLLPGRTRMRFDLSDLVPAEFNGDFRAHRRLMADVNRGMPERIATRHSQEQHAGPLYSEPVNHNTCRISVGLIEARCS